MSQMMFCISNPDEVEVSLSITMPVRDWRIFLEQLREIPGGKGAGYPCWQIKGEIEDMFKLVEKDILYRKRDGERG